MRLFDEADLPERDDREAWLARAERLSAGGDARGEAIRLEFEGGERSELAAAYEAVERQLGLDALRADGSWQFGWERGVLDEARFGPAVDGGSRRALVERILAERPGPAGADADDPERWEGVLLAAVLDRPVSRWLRVLDVRLTDYHHSAERAAVALAGQVRPRLERFSFGFGFEYLFESGVGSAGSRLDPMDHLHKGLVQTDVWEALPALRTLELEGAFLFPSVDHDGLTRLRTRGAVIADGSVFLPGRLPSLTSLEVELECDVFGVACSADQLDELAVTAAWYPNLRRLDLGRLEFDAGADEVLAALAESPLLPQLEALALRDPLDGEGEGEGDDGDGPGLPAALAPRFAHLELRVAGRTVHG
ncbi:hypothetical protein ACFCX4_24555 [Kitasatospora sp. NPDC056327]|uniref:hypothetical protein n=1 Tax=Kitasatospora sp. NPDC056327 TaxID=3345785 RepID=UPI0035D94358